MNPTSVRNLLLSLGLASGLGAAVNGCSSQDPGGPNGTGDGLGGDNGLGGYNRGVGGGNLLGPGGAGGTENIAGMNGSFDAGAGGVFGTGGNMLRGGASGQTGEPPEAGADSGGDAMSTAGDDGSTSSDADPTGG